MQTPLNHTRHPPPPSPHSSSSPSTPSGSSPSPPPIIPPRRPQLHHPEPLRPPAATPGTPSLCGLHHHLPGDLLAPPHLDQPLPRRPLSESFAPWGPTSASPSSTPLNALLVFAFFRLRRPATFHSSLFAAILFPPPCIAHRIRCLGHRTQGRPLGLLLPPPRHARLPPAYVLAAPNDRLSSPHPASASSSVFSSSRILVTFPDAAPPRHLAAQKPASRLRSTLAAHQREDSRSFSTLALDRCHQHLHAGPRQGQPSARR